MAEPAVSSPVYTYRDVEHLDPHRHPGELAQGEWLPMTRGTVRHGKVAANAVRIVGRYLDAHPCGELLTADPGMMLARGPDTLRGPDVAFIAAERVPAEGLPDEWWQGAPDLAIKVQSKSQSAYDLQQKALEYLRGGAKAVWVLDPASRRAVIYTAPNLVQLLTEEETLEGGKALPGFECRVGQFFD